MSNAGESNLTITVLQIEGGWDLICDISRTIVEDLDSVYRTKILYLKYRREIKFKYKLIFIKET